MTDTSSPDGGPRNAREKRLRTFLIISLAANLLVLGAVVGMAMGWGWRGTPQRISSRSGEDYGLMAFTRQLPQERRKEVRKTIREERANVKPLFIEVDENRRAAARLLTVEPFDRAAFEAALDRLAASEDRLKRSALGVVLKTSDALTPDERRKLGEWWEKRKSRYSRRASSGATKKAGKKEAPPSEGSPQGSQ